MCIGGGITGDVQINDTHIHHRLKAEYRVKESELMLKKLKEEPNKVPSPSRDQMMEMLVESWNTVIENVDVTYAMKQLFILNKLDGSEDYLVSDTLFSLVGDKIQEFRKELLKADPLQT